MNECKHRVPSNKKGNKVPSNKKGNNVSSGTLEVDSVGYGIEDSEPFYKSGTRHR